MEKAILREAFLARAKRDKLDWLMNAAFENVFMVCGAEIFKI